MIIMAWIMHVNKHAKYNRYNKVITYLSAPSIYRSHCQNSLIIKGYDGHHTLIDNSNHY